MSAFVCVIVIKKIINGLFGDGRRKAENTQNANNGGDGTRDDMRLNRRGWKDDPCEVSKLWWEVL